MCSDSCLIFGEIADHCLFVNVNVVNTVRSRTFQPARPWIVFVKARMMPSTSTSSMSSSGIFKPSVSSFCRKAVLKTGSSSVRLSSMSIEWHGSLWLQWSGVL